MNLKDYKTPDTDAAEIYVKTFSKKGRLEGMNSHSRDLERRLALCRDALEEITKYGPRRSLSEARELAECALEATKPKL